MLGFPGAGRVEQVLEDAAIVQQRCARVGIDFVIKQRVIEGHHLHADSRRLLGW
jgi:hypothetical protein